MAPLELSGDLDVSYPVVEVSVTEKPAVDVAPVVVPRDVRANSSSRGGIRKSVSSSWISSVSKYVGIFTFQPNGRNGITRALAYPNAVSSSLWNEPLDSCQATQ